MMHIFFGCRASEHMSQVFLTERCFFPYIYNIIYLIVLDWPICFVQSGAFFLPSSAVVPDQ